MINTHRHPTLLTDSLMGNFNELMSDLLHEQGATSNIPKRIAINLAEKENGYEVLALIPGFAKEDIKVNVEDSMLTISAHPEANETDNTQAKHKQLITEIPTGTFQRQLRLPKNSDTNAVEASYENGILKLYLAKRKETLAKTIEIK